MPKAKRPAASKKKPARAPEPASEQQLLLRQLARQGLPLLAILLAVFLFLGRFNFGGPLPVKLYELAAQAFGLAGWTALPALVVYFSILKFVRSDGGIAWLRWLLACLLLLSLAGMLHVFPDAETAGSLAAEGQGGGYVGYGINRALQQPLNAWLTFLFLFLVGAVCLGALADLTPKDVFAFFKRLFAKPPPERNLKVNRNTPLDKPAKKPEFKLHKGVPVETAAAVPAAAVEKGPKDALVVPADPDWRFPPLNLLNQKQDKADAGDIQANAEIIRETLANFSIDVEMEGANVGPRVTQYTLKPPSGIKLARIVGLESNIALDLAASSIRIEAPIPGKRAVGIEVPNKKAATVRLSSLLASDDWRKTKPASLAFCIGKDISGQPEIAQLERMPHLLLAGQTGSGKSVGINVLLTSLLYRNSPSDLKLILVDPKQVELGPYNDVPHLLTPVITSPEKCISALKWTVAEMERRLKAFAEVGKRNIAEYNGLKDQPPMPFVVVVIDELADLMMVASRDVEALVVRIAQKARAAGIHLVLATQRPSVDVITGLIKANIPARLAFTTASQVDSRTILDQIGAEKLLGSGDILYINASLPKPKRLQGAFISDAETEKVCNFLREQREVVYDSEVVSQQVSLSGGRGQIAADGLDGGEADDELFNQAVEVVVAAGKASTSLLQRRLRVGYARAARLIETLEEQGIIGPGRRQPAARGAQGRGRRGLRRRGRRERRAGRRRRRERRLLGGAGCLPESGGFCGMIRTRVIGLRL